MVWHSTLHRGKGARGGWVFVAPWYSTRSEISLKAGLSGAIVVYSVLKEC